MGQLVRVGIRMYGVKHGQEITDDKNEEKEETYSEVGRDIRIYERDEARDLS